MKQYESYKESGIEWLGQIPSHWNIVHIKNFFQVISGATPDSSNTNYWDGDIKWITPADFKTSDHFVSTGKRNITEEGYNSCGTSLVPAGSLIFSKRAPIGTVAISSNVLCTNQGCLSCVPFEKICYSPYYYYLFSVLTEAFEMLGSGSTFLEISANNFSNFPISAPPFKEQQTIAAYLDYKVSQIDAAITEKEQMLEDLKEYRSSIIHEAVTKGLDKNVEMKDSGLDWIGRIPQHWHLNRLKYFSSVSTGSTPSTSVEKYWDNATEDWYTPSDFNEDNIHLESSSRKVSNAAFNEAACRVFKEGVVLVVGIGATLGKVGISNHCCSANQQINAIEFGETVVPLYGAYYLSSMKEVMKSVANSATLAIMNQSVTGDLPFLCPPIEEQNRIISFLEDKISTIRVSIGEIQSQIEDLKAYKSSLISESVTGKVDLSDWKHND